jgi:antitoxin ParD1/3/4
MQAYRKKLVIEDPKRVILTDLPFRAGQTVEVLVLEEQADRERRAEDLKRLLKDTQALTQLSSITEEEIAAEIAAYRAGR